ncbi:hypothetical protein [Streptomyces sp. NPDC050738]|uniref:hypothetical protein n=1 Tax=Streptomyces sp. NPDC050738 TaxID=3154744 RepID=UPI003440E4A5
MRVMLFLGGLLALGFFFGGQAHAAEPVVPKLPGVSDAQPVRQVRELAAPVTDTVEQVASPVRKLAAKVGTALPVRQTKPPVLVPVTPEPQQASPKQSGPQHIGTASKPRVPAAEHAAPRTAAAHRVAYRQTQAAAPPHQGQVRPPVRQQPVDPCGVDGKWSAEGHTPRTGEPHAVPAAGSTRFVLARGAGRPATDEPVRDRPHDILEFPG